MHRILLLSSLLSLFMPALAGADETQNTKKSFLDNISGEIGLYSHYVGRGRVQADDDPALQASINYNQEIAKNTNIFMGVWGSNTEILMMVMKQRLNWIFMVAYRILFKI